MTKKLYEMPQLEVVMLEVETSILVDSNNVVGPDDEIAD
jgi:hypothetical protein